MKARSYLLIIFVVLILISVYLWTQYQKAMQYDYHIAAASFSDIGMNKTAGQIVFSVSNPSRLSGTVVESSLNLFVNNVYISNLAVNEKTIIAPESEFLLPLNFEFAPTKILSLKNIFGLKDILNPDKAMLGINGYVTVKKGIFKIRIPISINESFTWWKSIAV